LVNFREERVVAKINSRPSAVALKATRLVCGCPWRCVAKTPRLCDPSKTLIDSGILDSEFGVGFSQAMVTLSRRQFI
jgi:hypothetical protein